MIGCVAWSRRDRDVVFEYMQKGQKPTEAEIDAAFAKMAHDRDYRSAATSTCREFEFSDWETTKGLDTE